MKKYKKSNIYKHQHNDEECFSSVSQISYCFSTLDYGSTQFQIKINESMYIDCEEPNLKKQLNQLATTLSL